MRKFDLTTRRTKDTKGSDALNLELRDLRGEKSSTPQPGDPWFKIHGETGCASRDAVGENLRFGFDGQFVVCEAKQGGLAVDDGLQSHIPPPQLLQILKRFFGVFELQVAAVVIMFKK